MKPHEIQAQTDADARVPDPIHAQKPRAKRTDCLVVRATFRIPLDMSDANSLYTATKAIDALEASLPEGTKVEFQSKTFGKM